MPDTGPDPAAQQAGSYRDWTGYWILKSVIGSQYRPYLKIGYPILVCHFHVLTFPHSQIALCAKNFWILPENNPKLELLSYALKTGQPDFLTF